MSQLSDSDLDISSADRAALGSLRSIHPTGTFQHRSNIGIFLVLTVLLVGAAIAFVILGLIRNSNTCFVTAVVFGSLALPTSVGLYFQMRKRGWRLYLFDNGFVFAQGQDRVVRWEDVKFFYEWSSVAAYRKADLNVRFNLHDGAHFEMDSCFKDMETFTKGVRSGVTQVILKQGETALSSGQAVSFGKVLLSQVGLETNGQMIPWEEVHSICLEPRIFRSKFRALGMIIYRRNPKSNSGKAELYARAVPEFPNFTAFIQLASRFTTVSNEGSNS